ncbi:MAG: hypothetical protein WCK05_07790, partial [Planctomycetota bacterium]
QETLTGSLTSRARPFLLAFDSPNGRRSCRSGRHHAWHSPHVSAWVDSAVPRDQQMQISMILTLTDDEAKGK